MNLKAQTDAASPPKESRRPSLVNRLNTVNGRSTEFGRVCVGRHIGPNQHPTVNRRSTEFGRVRRRGHTSVCRPHGLERNDRASAAADTSTCEGGLCWM